MIFIINKACFLGIRCIWRHGLLPVVSEDVSLPVRTVVSVASPSSLEASGGMPFQLDLVESEVYCAICPIWGYRSYQCLCLMKYPTPHFLPSGYLLCSSENILPFHPFWNILPLTQYLIISGVCKAFNLILTLILNYHFFNFPFTLWVISLEFGRGQDISTYACNILSYKYVPFSSCFYLFWILQINDLVLFIPRKWD